MTQEQYRHASTHTDIYIFVVAGVSTKFSVLGGTHRSSTGRDSSNFYTCSHTHTHTYSHIHTYSLSLSHTHTHKHTHTHTNTHSRCTYKVLYAGGYIQEQDRERLKQLPIWMAKYGLSVVSHLFSVSLSNSIVTVCWAVCTID